MSLTSESKEKTKSCKHRESASALSRLQEPLKIQKNRQVGCCEWDSFLHWQYFSNWFQIKRIVKWGDESVKKYKKKLHWFFPPPICLIPGWLLDNMLPVGFKYTSSESTNLWSIRSFLVNIILLIIIISDNITIINMIKITTRSISLAASLWWSLGSASSSTQRSNQYLLIQWQIV